MKPALSEAARLAQQGWQAYKAGRYEQAADHFQQAERAYQEAGEAGLAAEMANNLSVAYVQLGRHQAALGALQGTYDTFVQQEDLIRAAQALGNEAAALEGLQAWEDAETRYQQAAEHFEALGEQDHLRYTLQALSRVRLRQGRPLEAVSTMQGALGSGQPSWRARLVRKILSLPARLFKP